MAWPEKRTGYPGLNELGIVLDEDHPFWSRQEAKLETFITHPLLSVIQPLKSIPPAFKH